MTTLKITMAIVCLISTGCNFQRGTDVGSETAQQIVDSLRYVKDQKTGNCFAIVASRELADIKSNGFTITWVPCPAKKEKRP